MNYNFSSTKLMLAQLFLFCCFLCDSAAAGIFNKLFGAASTPAEYALLPQGLSHDADNEAQPLVISTAPPAARIPLENRDRTQCAQGKEARMVQSALSQNSVIDLVFYITQTQDRMLTDFELDLVNELLISGASVDEREAKSGMTSLMLAVQRGDVNLVRMLIRHGANCKAQHTNSIEDSALSSRHMSQELIVELALANKTIASLIVYINRLENRYLAETELLLVEDLLRAGAAVDQRCLNATPLFYACGIQDVNLVALLMRFGANKNLKYLNSLPADYAAGNRAILDELSRQGAR